MKVEKKEIEKISPIRKNDILCQNNLDYIDNALFLVQVVMNNDEEKEETLIKDQLIGLTELFESLMENDLVAEMIYKELIKLNSLVETYYSQENTICPNCKSSNILVTESDEETENKCLDCSHFFTTE